MNKSVLNSVSLSTTALVRGKVSFSKITKPFTLEEVIKRSPDIDNPRAHCVLNVSGARVIGVEGSPATTLDAYLTDKIKEIEMSRQIKITQKGGVDNNPEGKNTFFTNPQNPPVVFHSEEDIPQDAKTVNLSNLKPLAIEDELAVGQDVILVLGLYNNKYGNHVALRGVAVVGELNYFERSSNLSRIGIPQEAINEAFNALSNKANQQEEATEATENTAAQANSFATPKEAAVYGPKVKAKVTEITSIPQEALTDATITALLANEQIKAVHEQEQAEIEAAKQAPAQTSAQAQSGDIMNDPRLIQKVSEISDIPANILTPEIINAISQTDEIQAFIKTLQAEAVPAEETKTDEIKPGLVNYIKAVYGVDESVITPEFIEALKATDETVVTLSGSGDLF